MTSPAGALARNLYADPAPRPGPARGDVFAISFQPILDVARGVPAGFQAQRVVGVAGRPALDTPYRFAPEADPAVLARMITMALRAARSLPPSTFLSVPVGLAVVSSPQVRRALAANGGLHGIVLDMIGPLGPVPDPELEAAVREFKAEGALIGVGGYGAQQPALTSIVRLEPAILRLGRDWVRGIDQSAAKCSAVELIGQLATDLRAGILADGVTSEAELRALARLKVPLAQGPFIGGPEPGWLGGEGSGPARGPVVVDGELRGLVRPARTTTDAAAAAAGLAPDSEFDVVVVVDEHARPTLLLEQSRDADWSVCEATTVNVGTPLPEAISQAMARPRVTRFTPLACIDDAGRFLGVVHIDRVLSHLARPGH